MKHMHIITQASDSGSDSGRHSGFGVGAGLGANLQLIRKPGAWLATLLMPLAFAVGAQTPPPVDHAAMGHSPYAGQQVRTITSLSEDDQKQLLTGGGWGLAKPAEFNGAPGPAHLLELKNEIGLSDAQVKAIEAMYADMQSQAIELGKRYIETEREIDAYFKSKQISDAVLRQKVDAAAKALADLRFLHLSYHHRTQDVVTPEQVTKYNALRGYGPATTGSSDPCANVPPGHDPVMFRKHMGCKP
jgi:Spy/CpxP family protein refolding chaperone